MSTGWCGVCHLEKARREAADNPNLAVTVQRSVDDCGWDVYLHPKNVVIPSYVRRRDEPDLPEVKYWHTWLFDKYETQGCVCGYAAEFGS